MAAQAGLCLAWSETPKDTFCRVVAHLHLLDTVVYGKTTLFRFEDNYINFLLPDVYCKDKIDVDSCYENLP